MQPSFKSLGSVRLAGFVARVIRAGTLLAFMMFLSGCRQAAVEVRFPTVATGESSTEGFGHPFWLQTEFERIKSTSVLYPVIKELKLVNRWGANSGLGRELTIQEVYERLKRQLNVRIDETNTIIEVFAKNKNLSEAREIGNSIKAHYLEVRERNSSRRKDAGIDAPIIYHNAQYDFTFSLPASWQGYSVIVENWDRQMYLPATGEAVGTEHFPVLVLRHPEWKAGDPRQDIPILVLARGQWQAEREGKLRIFAGGVEDEIEHDPKYVFEVSSRFNSDDSVKGWKEAADIVSRNIAANRPHLEPER